MNFRGHSAQLQHVMKGALNSDSLSMQLQRTMKGPVNAVAPHHEVLRWSLVGAFAVWVRIYIPWARCSSCSLYSYGNYYFDTLYHSNYYCNTFYLFDLLERSLLAWCISECLLLDSSRLPTLSSTKSLSLSLFTNAWSDIVGQLFLVLTRSETPSARPVHLRSILLPQGLSNDSSHILTQSFGKLCTYMNAMEGSGF
jgi:hypothetical protein